MCPTARSITWTGESRFRTSGSGLHEDTLRIESDAAKFEARHTLRLPTLCITYADMAFQNQVGGQQRNWPHSQSYGARYFSPDVEIAEADIERLTYIRGATRVTIGANETAIEFPSWHTLVVPRLRIDRAEEVAATLSTSTVQIPAGDRVNVLVKQYADGRHVGGLRIEKRHPSWREEQPEPLYDLQIRVVEGGTLRPIPEAVVDVWHFDPEAPTPHGVGGFRHDGRLVTDATGTVSATRPSDQLEAYTVRHRGWRAVARCLRPLAGQPVHLHMRAWPLDRTTISTTWSQYMMIDEMAALTDTTAEALLHLNRLRSTTQLRPGMPISLPCSVARYALEGWDTLDRIARRFGYGDAVRLAAVNHAVSPDDLLARPAIELPDWHFLTAPPGASLDRVEAMFDLPRGAAVTVGQVHHPDARLPIGGETIAVPTRVFAERPRR